MNAWFEEKTQQLDTCTVIAFGIKLTSRYGKVSEMIEMFEFAEETAASDLSTLVQDILYDSQVNICSFTFADSISENSIEAGMLLSCAEKNINNFEWFGQVFHRRD